MSNAALNPLTVREDNCISNLKECMVNFDMKVAQLLVVIEQVKYPLWNYRLHIYLRY